jgi:2,4-dienoyl-CoA reductase-like NADH-dependent reductase (Old Yellow Enzyme family)
MTDSPLARPIQLPCGLEIKNRLAKAAMAEQMADSSKLPTTAQLSKTYGAWGDGGWGMILTGNAQIDVRHLGGPDDYAIDLASLSEEKVLESFRSLATACRRGGTPTLVQINHPGRQSPLGAGKRSFFTKTLAPSAVALNMGSDLLSRILGSLVFGTPKEMSLVEIDDVVQRFVNAAKISAAAGFDGVEIHAAHGYLLAQFLSAKSNRRTDAYGGSAAARAKIVVDIIHAIRAAVPKTFCVGLKLNSADHQASSTPEASKELQECLEQAALLVEAGLDFLEISGGSYENPTVRSILHGPIQRFPLTLFRW